MAKDTYPRAAVIISANIEWQSLLNMFRGIDPQASPLGNWFVTEMDIDGQSEPVLFFHGGWGKISAAASAQYVLDRWSPKLLLNLGTCGGFEEVVEKDTIILVERTVVYDIIEQMTDHAGATAQYTTDIDLSWLSEPYPHPVQRTLLVSGDRDLVTGEIPYLQSQFGAIAGDWESGAIAWVASRNQTRCLILRGVTDLVGRGGGEAYEGNLDVFITGTRRVFEQVVPHLPRWIALGLTNK